MIKFEELERGFGRIAKWPSVSICLMFEDLHNSKMKFFLFLSKWSFRLELKWTFKKKFSKIFCGTEKKTFNYFTRVLHISPSLKRLTITRQKINKWRERVMSERGEKRKHNVRRKVNFTSHSFVIVCDKRQQSLLFPPLSFAFNSLLVSLRLESAL